MDVSKHLPSTQALREEPLPRWQMDDPAGFVLEAKHFQRAGGHEAVAGAVEAV